MRALLFAALLTPCFALAAHLRLTYFYQGRDQRLTDVHGENEVTKTVLA